jgi:hypothetical protein
VHRLLELNLGLWFDPLLHILLLKLTNRSSATAVVKRRKADVGDMILFIEQRIKGSG